MAGAVLLDTNVLSSRLAPRSPLPALYDRHVVGRRIAVAAQTVAEIRYGALVAGWGERRLAQIERLVHRSLCSRAAMRRCGGSRECAPPHGVRDTLVTRRST